MPLRQQVDAPLPMRNTRLTIFGRRCRWQVLRIQGLRLVLERGERVLLPV